MKLASLKGGRDGRLVVVSNDLTRCASADAVAPTLQAALDDWANTRPALEAIAKELEAGGGSIRAHAPHLCRVPISGRMVRLT